ncbi:MAG: hypothetical protein JXX14_08295, partial [Deltaproteobacteria bacterium]|nr:hypothetical protein [Deltaproteobacteria bacterium]
NQVGNDGTDKPAMHFRDTLFRGNDGVLVFDCGTYWCIFNAFQSSRRFGKGGGGRLSNPRICILAGPSGKAGRDAAAVAGGAGTRDWLGRHWYFQQAFSAGIFSGIFNFDIEGFVDLTNAIK